MLKNIHWIILILATPFLLPVFDPGFDVGTILTIISLLFAILAGFFIATATSNYLRLQTLISDEDSNLISIYRYVKIIDPRMASAVSDAIDKYVIAGLDYDLLLFATPTRKLLEDIVNVVEKVKPSDERGLALLQNLHSEKSELFTTNQEMALTAKKIVSPRHWLILIILAVLIAGMLLSLRNGSYMSSVVVSLSMVAVFETLLLIRAVDSNSFLAYQLAYENVQHIFVSIDKLPYYPASAFKEYRGLAEAIEKPYRVGYPKSTENVADKEIRVVS